MDTRQSAMQALKAFQKADDEWSEQLHAVYGKWAGDARYNNGLNGATPLLRRLKVERMAAFNEWERSKATHNGSVDA
jgi:hypothetical protein